MPDEKLTLGGREWNVPELSARRIIAFSRLVLSLGRINVDTMSEVELEKLYDALLIGLQQGKPDLTKDELMDLPIPIDKAMAAVNVVAKQAGLEFKTVPQPAAPESPSTPPNSKPNGTTSLPTS